MYILFYIFTFILGLIIGSFLNVVILRYNTGHTLSGRSKCFSCNKTLRWYELVPLFSYLVQKGKCRGCLSRISSQYFAVELLTGILFSLLAYQYFYHPGEVLFYWLVVSVLVVITVYDLKHKIIPDSLVYLFIVATLFRPFFTVDNLALFSLAENSYLMQIWPYLTSGVLIFLFFWALWYFSDGRWMGFGDAKLGLGIGLLLGLRGGINAVVLAFWIGAITGLLLIILSRWPAVSSYKKYITIKSELPFAPFLFIGLLLTLIFGPTLFFF